MMQSFTEGIDKIYYDLDDIDDLRNKIHVEASLKDVGKAIKPHVLPWAAVAALGTGAYSALKPDMSPQEKFDNASAVFQYTVISDQLDPDKSAKQFVNLALTLPYKDRKRLKNHLKDFEANIPRHRRQRMEEFQQSINYWVNQFNVDRWSQKDESLKENNRLDSKFDQDVFNILDPLEAQIESGEYTQEEIVDIVAQELSSQLGAEISTEEGARIEQKVEHFYTMIGLDSIPADRRSRDYLDGRSAEAAPVVDENIPTGVPRQVEGQPVVHTDDDFLLFLEWVIRQVDENGELKYTARSVVDIITSPHDGWFTSLYKKYKNQSQRVEEDPYL